MLRASLLKQATALARNAPSLASRSTFAPTLSLPPLQRSSYATTPKHIRKRQKKAEQAQRPPVYAESLLQLRNALDENNISLIAHAYNGIRTQLPLGPQDVDHMAQATHAALRLLSSDIKRKRIPPDLVNFADILATDIQARVLPPSYAAHLHLLSFYKEAAEFEKGKNFWSWLAKQDDSYVNAKLYGVAIELLAFQGAPAHETERLYLKALKRFPGSFLEYHLSPDAVVPDRSQPTNIRGIPITLIQGILTARILRGDAHNAYLALDTALRLFPTRIPSRLFTLFVQERPLPEAYKCFQLACRAGSTLGGDALKILITRLRNAAAARPLENAGLVRSMLTASYAYIASGNALTSNCLNEVIIAVTGLLKSNVVARLSPEQLKPVTNSIMVLVRKLFAIGSDLNTRPGIAAFNSIIANVAGKGKREDLIATTLDDIKRYGLEPNAVTRRSLLVAAGDLGNRDLLQSTWTDLVAQRIAASAALDLPDWQNLANAAKRADDRNYVREQLINFEHIITPHIASRIGGMLDEDIPKAEEQVSGADPTEMLQVIELLGRDLDYMAEHAHHFRNFNLEPMPLSLRDSELYNNVPEQHIRAVYDEMTIDPSAQHVKPESSLEAQAQLESEAGADAESPKVETEPTLSPPPPAVSTTGFPLDELRYQNWKTINELLYDAEKYDSEYLAAVDDAIKNGRTPPKRDLSLADVPKTSDMVGVSNLETMSTSSERTAYSEERSLEDIRQEIFRLRGRLA